MTHSDGDTASWCVSTQGPSVTVPMVKGEQRRDEDVLVVRQRLRRRPNRGLQRTALGADQIGAILEARISSAAFPIYGCAAAEAQAVRRQPRTSVPAMSAVRVLARVLPFWDRARHDRGMAHQEPDLP